MNEIDVYAVGYKDAIESVQVKLLEGSAAAAKLERVTAQRDALLAAADELLDCAIECQTVLDEETGEWYSDWAALRDAIAKTEGDQ